MPTPDGLPVSSLHGEFKQPNAAATPKQGTVTFTPTPTPIAFPDQNVLILGTETATLDANGEFTIQLVSTDTANANPSGWTYRVTEKIIGEVPRQYNILLPYSVGTVELSDITPVDAAPTYLPVIGPQGPPGIVQSVNGYSAISITLNSADVGAIALTQKAAANGVATLDSGTKIPVAQLPDLSSTYIATTQKGAASGVASLDASSHLTASQYDWDATTPAAIANAGAVGTSTKPARSDHTHAGVALTGAQTVAGIKTFSSSPVVPTPSGATDAVNKSYVDGAGTFTGAKSYALTTTGDLMLGVQITGDTNRRWQVLADGSVSWGPGNAALDTTLSRTGVNELTFAGQLRLSNTNDVSLTSTNHALQVGPTTGTNVRIDNNEIMSANNGAINTLLIQADGGNLSLFSNTAAFLQVRGAGNFQNDAAGAAVLGFKVVGDSQDRLNINSDGKLSWGSGSATADTVLFRESAGILSTTATGFRSYRAASSDFGFSTRVAADTQSRWYVEASGTINWGTGALAADTNLYRNGTGALKTDGNFSAGGTLGATGNFTGAANVNTGAWTSYTPQWLGGVTNPVLNNGTLTGRYCLIGKMCTVMINLKIGSTSTMGSGLYSFTLPFAAVNRSTDVWLGSSNASDTGNANYPGIAQLAGGQTAVVCINPSGTGGANPAGWTNTSPFTWGNTDVAQISLTYEIA